MKIFSDELGQISQGIIDILGTDTIWFICRSALPKGYTVTHGRICVNYCHKKKDSNRKRLTVGGDRSHYPLCVSTPTSHVSTSKILFNCVISTPGAIFITMDIKNFYLVTPMKRPEYMCLPINILPQEIIDQYKFKN